MEVGIEQRAVAASVARDSHELGACSTQVDVGAELHRSTVGEAVVGRRSTVVVPAAVRWRCRPLDCLILAVIQLVVVVQRQSCVVDAQESAVSESNST